MSEHKKELEFKIIFADEYNPVYANGAWGGFSHKGELVMHFTHERQPAPHKIYHESQDGQLWEEIRREPKAEHLLIIRYVATGVTMNLETAKSVHAWMGKQIEQYEALQQQGETKAKS